MKSLIRNLFLIALACLDTGILNAQDPPPVKNRILFILDASGSMYETMDGKTRIVIAKDVLSKLVDSLRDNPNLELALRVFGHQFDKKYNNCQDTKLEIPFKAKNHDDIIKKIKGLDPKGTTLIANSIEAAANDFPQEKNTRNIIILITDGIEACGGDPCALSIALQKKNIFLRPFIIGFGSDASFQKAFSCMGQYLDANDSKSFRKVLDKVLNQALSKTTVRVNLLDTKDKPTETNVNISFINSVTGRATNDYVHFINSTGKSDLVDIDPVLTYDIVVNTIPPVTKENVSFEGGKENIVSIKTPQGSLFFKNSYKEYKQLPMIIRQTGSSQILNVQLSNTSQKYITGNYDVEILTLPRTIFRNVKIEQSKTTTLEIQTPGAVNIPDKIEGYGSIYQIKDNGEQIWVCNLENEISSFSSGMQPGNYKLVFRSKKSTGSKHTSVKLFTINPGATTNIKL
jgi:Ca-activated chloride channel homolog